MYEFLSSYQDMFAKPKYNLRKVPFELAKVVIEIGHNLVLCWKPYRLCELRRREVNKIIDEMIASDIIKKSDVSGGAPALLRQKLNKSWGLVLNYIELNKVCKKRCYPMPNVDYYITVLGRFSYFTVVNLAHGYFQIELSEAEREKTAFVTEDGKYQFKRLPMGLVDAPYYFQRLINRLMGRIKYSACLEYFDDIPIMGTTFEDLLVNMKLVFKKLQEYNLKCRPDKCKFGIREIKFLGHIVSEEGVKPDPEKISVLKKLKPPTTLKQLQSHLGCYNYFSRYNKDFATLAAPLY